MGVEPGATLEEIQQKYRQRIKEYHADLVASLGIELRVLAEEKSKQINLAYEQALKSLK